MEYLRSVGYNKNSQLEIKGQSVSLHYVIFLLNNNNNKK